jgi:two-component system, response regulator PdtaR
MMLLQTHSNPVQLWLAANASHGDDSPERDEAHEQLHARPLRILVVEDEFFISLDTKALLQSMGHAVVAIAVSADQAVRMAGREMPDVVLMDIRLAGTRDGIDAAEEIRSRFGISSIFVTANSDPQTRRRAQAVQPMGFLEKPLTEQRLRLGLSRVGR